MIIKPTLFVLLSFLAFTYANAQQLSALQVCQKVFSRDSLPNLRAYCTGEYEGRPNGRDLDAHVKINFRQLENTDATAVIDMTITDTSGLVLDTYLHLKKAGGWKIEAFRALAMTGMIQELNKGLKKMTSAEINKMILTPKSKGKDYRLFKTREEYNYLIKNSDLTLASDDEIVAHFKKNKDKFDQLRAAMLKLPSNLKSKMIRALAGDNLVSSKLKELYLHGAEYDGEGTTNTLMLNIGGIIDNFVGYMYIPKDKDVPQMDPSHFIMVREIGDGWYMYKTT